MLRGRVLLTKPVDAPRVHRYDHDGAGFSRQANFETASRAISTLVRMATGDSWSALLADAVHNPHVSGVKPPMYATVLFLPRLLHGLLP